MSQQVVLRFFLDNCVPDSVGRVLSEADHEVIYQRDVLDPEAPDLMVALASANNNAILVSLDKDYKAIATRFKISHGRLRKLSRIDLTCLPIEAASRLKLGLPLIETEWAVSQSSKDKRMFIRIGSSFFTTVR